MLAVMNMITPPPTGPQQPISNPTARGKAAKKAANPHNFYPTPPAAVEALLDKEVFPGSIWEPCAGVGHVTRVLKARGHTDVWETDVVQHQGYLLSQGPADFLTLTRTVDHIVTNPPYDQAEAMVRHARKQARGKVAMLLRLAFLESAVRKDFFEDHPPARVWVFRKRLTLYPHYLLNTANDETVAQVQAAGRPRGSRSGTVAFAWFIWDTSHSRPTIGWI